MRFSVIIPLYNKSHYVRKAMQSVLGQSFRDYELIVVDDGSTDGSASVVESITDERLRIIRQENAGVSVARNNGVAASGAPYLCFLDADDWWEPTFLEEINRLIDEFPNAGIFGTNYMVINETKHKTRMAPIGLPEGFERGYINYCQAYVKNMGMPLTSSSVCIPRAVFSEMGGFPAGISLGEDFIFWIHITLKHKVAFLNKLLSNYNQDIAVAKRAVGQLHNPEHHMLWNLKDLEPEERVNADYKLLIDKLRVTGLMPYYLSKQYHEAALSELSKVDWTKQPEKIRREYHKPLFFLRTKQRLMKQGSRIKTAVKRVFK